MLRLSQTHHANTTPYYPRFTPWLIISAAELYKAWHDFVNRPSSSHPAILSPFRPPSPNLPLLAPTSHVTSLHNVDTHYNGLLFTFVPLYVVLSKLGNGGQYSAVTSRL